MMTIIVSYWCEFCHEEKKAGMELDFFNDDMWCMDCGGKLVELRRSELVEFDVLQMSDERSV